MILRARVANDDKLLKSWDCSGNFVCFWEDNFLLPPLQIKNEIVVLSQRIKGKSLDMFFPNELADPLDMKILEV